MEVHFSVYNRMNINHRIAMNEISNLFWILFAVYIDLVGITFSVYQYRVIGFRLTCTLQAYILCWYYYLSHKYIFRIPIYVENTIVQMWATLLVLGICVYSRLANSNFISDLCAALKYYILNIVIIILCIYT